MDTITKQIFELTDEDTLVGKEGGTSKVYDAFPSENSIPSLWRVETEHGNSLMSPYDEVQVKA